MNYKLTTLIITLCLTFVLVPFKKAAAETPCTYLGQERVEDIYTCLNSYSQSQHLKGHHLQMMNIVAGSNFTPPHYQHLPTGDSFLRTMSMVAMYDWARKYHKTRYYPWMLYYYTSPYFYGY